MNAGVSWPIEKMAEATEAIARSRRWGSGGSAGVETEAVTLRYAAIESELRALGPALVILDAGSSGSSVPRSSSGGGTEEPRGTPRNRGTEVLAIVRTDARHAHALTPDGRRVAVPLRELREQMCAGVEARYAADVDRVLAMSGIAAKRRERSRAAMLRELVGDAPVGQLRLVRPRLENARAVVRDARLLKKALAFVAMSAAEMLLFVLSWWILGLMAFDTRSLDTLFALWLLAVLTIVPLRAGGVAAARSLVMEAGSIIKRRILLGALKLSPDEVNGKGVGTFLSHVLESGHVEALGTSGAFAGLTSLLAGIAAIYVLSHVHELTSFQESPRRKQGRSRGRVRGHLGSGSFTDSHHCRTACAAVRKDFGRLFRRARYASELIGEGRHGTRWTSFERYVDAARPRSPDSIRLDVSGSNSSSRLLNSSRLTMPCRSSART